MLVLKNYDKEVWRGSSAIKRDVLEKIYHDFQFTTIFIYQLNSGKEFEGGYRLRKGSIREAKVSSP